jgi:hypothetical protein
VTLLVALACSTAPSAPRPPEAPWWPEDGRYREAAVRAFAEDLVADGLANDVIAVDCAEYPCLAHVTGLVPRETWRDIDEATSEADAAFVRAERDAGYLPGGSTTVSIVPEGWATSRVVAALARPMTPEEMARLAARVERLAPSP